MGAGDRECPGAALVEGRHAMHPPRVSAYQWWRKAQTLAALEPKARRGWHSLRRKFAGDLMELPLKVLCELGAWKAAKTVLPCY